MISGKIRVNWREPGRENPQFTRWIFSNGEVIDVAEDIRDKGIMEQPICFARQIIGPGMASNVVFLELVSHIIEENISKMEIRMVLREDNGIVVRVYEFFQDDFLALHVGADAKAAPARCHGVRDQPL